MFRLHHHIYSTVYSRWHRCHLSLSCQFCLANLFLLYNNLCFFILLGIIQDTAGIMSLLFSSNKGKLI